MPDRTTLRALLIALALVLPGCGFDGQIGDGCDAGNANCTYEKWLPNCVVEIDYLDGVEPSDRTCRFIYRSKGGR